MNDETVTRLRLQKLLDDQWEDSGLLHLRKDNGGVATKPVPGVGSLAPRVIFVGEAPGAQEDREGLPFVGPSGRFLDELLDLAGLARAEVWITNVLKLRPEHNRTPDTREVYVSRRYLRREVAELSPNGARLLIGLGRTANETLAGETISGFRNHGRTRNLPGGHRLFCSYHPSWGIRHHTNADIMRADFMQLGRDLGTLHEYQTNRLKAGDL